MVDRYQMAFKNGFLGVIFYSQNAKHLFNFYTRKRGIRSVLDHRNK